MLEAHRGHGPQHRAGCRDRARQWAGARTNTYDEVESSACLACGAPRLEGSVRLGLPGKSDHEAGCALDALLARVPGLKTQAEREAAREAIRKAGL